jgi:c-di-GMP-binding flagellar brake protein YcgR
LKEERVNLVDISLGGAKFTYLKSYSFRPGDAVSFKLIIGSTVFNLEARVHEVWTPDNYGAGKNIQYVSVEFRHVDKQLEALLGKAIIEIERKLLSEGRI